MKTEHFKILWDYNEQYRFNTEAFKDCVINRVGVIKTPDSKTKNRTQLDILLQIADYCKISLETVKKWKYGDNGPGDIELVKDAADVLNVDYHILLTPIEKKDSKMKDVEKELVRAVREGCVETFYAYLKVDKIINNELEAAARIPEEKKTPKDDPKYIRETIFATVTDKVDELRMLIDKRSMDISSALRYKLLNIILELTALIDYDFPERWSQLPPDEKTGIEYVTLCNEEFCTYMGFDSEEDAIEDDDFGEGYIKLKIALAEKLGYIDTTELPDDFINQYLNYCNLNHRKIDACLNVVRFLKQYRYDHATPGSIEEIKQITEAISKAYSEQNYSEMKRLELLKEEKQGYPNNIRRSITNMYYVNTEMIVTDLVVDAINNVFRKDFPEYC